jgi:hypothetical protein
MVCWLVGLSRGATVGVDGGVISALISAKPALNILAARSSLVRVREQGGEGEDFENIMGKSMMMGVSAQEAMSNTFHYLLRSFNNFSHLLLD